MSSSWASRPARRAPALEGMDDEAQRIGGVRGGGVDAVGELACELHGFRSAHRAHLQRDALLHRPRCSGDTRVAEEVALEVDRALVEQGADHVDGFAQACDRARPAPLDPVLLERGEVADPQDHLGSAAAQLIERAGKLGDIGRIAQVDGGDTGTETDPF